MKDRDLHRRADERLEQLPDTEEQGEVVDELRLRREARLHETGSRPAPDRTATSEARMRQAIEAEELAVWDYDVKTGRVHLSESWSWLLGGDRTPTDTTIHELARSIPEVDQETVRAALIAALKGRDATEFNAVFRVRRTDGQLMWMQSEGRVEQRAADGWALRMGGVNRDITERKLLEEQLVMREARYRAVIQTAVDGFCVINMQGNLLEVNDVYVEQSGYSREELLHMRLSDLDPNESLEEMAIHIEQVKRKGYDRFDTWHRCKDGSIRPVEIVETYWRGFDRVFAFVVDRSERERAERKMKELRKELEALQKSQVAAQTAAAFAHELNQPLGAISSYTEAALIMLKAEQPNIKRLADTIEKSRDQALRAGNAIRELLELLNTGSVSADALDLNNEIRNALNLAKSDMELTFHTELRLEGALPAVRANRVHLQKVLLNLLHNAVESMQEAGVPQPAIIVTVSTRKEEALAQVSVRDNGSGIDPADIAHLFKSFFTTKKRGVGMGLAVSRSLIEANGGQLWCDPGEGPGATFHLTLPYAD